MDTKERETKIHQIGTELAKELIDFYGSIRINICAGKYVNSNIEQSIKPEPQKKGQ